MRASGVTGSNMKTRSALGNMGLVGILLSKAEAAATTTGASSTPNWARVYSADLRGAAAASTAETVVGEAAPAGSVAAVRAASAAAAEAAANDDPFRRLPGLELFYEGVKGDQPIADATHTTAGIFEMVEVSSGGDTYPATGGRLDIAVTDDLRTLDDGSQVEVDNGADNEKAGLPWLPLPFLTDTHSSHPGNSAVADPVGYKQVAYLATIMLAVSGIAFFGGRGLGLLYVAVLSLPMTSATPTGKDGCGGGDATDNVTWKLFDWFCRIVLAVGALRTLLKFFKDLWATRLEQRAAHEAALAEAEAGGHRVEEGGGGGGAPGAPAPLPADAPRASWFDTFATVCNGINAALAPRR